MQFVGSAISAMGHWADERCLDGTDILRSVRESWVHDHSFGHLLTSLTDEKKSAVSVLMTSDGRWRKTRNYVLQFLLKILGMWRVCSKLIPHVLASEQRERERENPLHICPDLLRKAEPDGRNAAGISTVEVKIIFMAEKQLGAG